MKNLLIWTAIMAVFSLMMIVDLYIHEQHPLYVNTWYGKLGLYGFVISLIVPILYQFYIMIKNAIK